VEHNLCGTLNLLELCKRHKAGFTLLSTSRVYSIPPLASLAMRVVDDAFVPAENGLPNGVSSQGVAELFTTSAPVSLYGATKLASEALALEYGYAFGLPVFVNRCGVLAGAGQFGRADQGIFSYWINSHLRRRPLRYIGFGGTGHQVRDCLHPADLVPVITAQMAAPSIDMGDRVVNFSGGTASAISLRQLNDWCDDRFGKHAVAVDPAPRAFDIPWMVLDSSRAAQIWNWKPKTQKEAILEEIAAHAGTHPGWLELSAPLG
jgi:CDP-paratose 2-epimerase